MYFKPEYGSVMSLSGLDDQNQAMDLASIFTPVNHLTAALTLAIDRQYSLLFVCLPDRLQKVIENKISFVHPSLFNKGSSDGPATPAMHGWTTFEPDTRIDLFAQDDLYLLHYNIILENKVW